MAIATAILMLPPVIEISTWMMRGASWTRSSLFFFAVPAAMTLAFPFAMTGAVDALRRHHSMPAHVARAAALKLGAFAFAVMLVYSGWVVPAANRLPQLNALWIPEGLDDKTGRKRLLEEHGIEVGGGLGDFAGKVWRVGLMGHGARPEIVDRALAAFKKVLGK